MKRCGQILDKRKKPKDLLSRNTKEPYFYMSSKTLKDSLDAEFKKEKKK